MSLVAACLVEDGCFVIGRLRKKIFWRPLAVPRPSKRSASPKSDATAERVMNHKEYYVLLEGTTKVNPLQQIHRNVHAGNKSGLCSQVCVAGDTQSAPRCVYDGDETTR